MKKILKKWAHIVLTGCLFFYAHSHSRRSCHADHCYRVIELFSSTSEIGKSFHLVKTGDNLNDVTLIAKSLATFAFLVYSSETGYEINNSYVKSDMNKRDSLSLRVELIFSSLFTVISEKKKLYAICVFFLILVIICGFGIYPKYVRFTITLI